MTGSYPNTGSLFQARKTDNPKAPTHEGEVEIDMPMLQYLNGQAKSGQPLKLRLAGWKRVAKSSGKTFLSLKVSEPRMSYGGKGAQPRPTAAPKEDDDLPF
jgi:hypothetical protein